MTDLSGVTAVQGVNNANAIRLIFEETNAKGGIHGRKIKYVLEDNQATPFRKRHSDEQAVESSITYSALANGGTPMNDAVLPSMFEKQVPNVFPLTCARSMYEPFNRF